MIRRLKENDYKQVMDLLSIDPMINCYMISDLMHLGFKQTYLTFYGVFKAKSLASVLMVYDTYGMVFSLDNNFEQDFIELLNKLPLTSLSGQDQTVRAIHSYLSDFPLKPMTLSVLDQTNECIDHPNVRKIFTVEEIEALYDLLKDIEEFNVKTQSKEAFVREKLNLNAQGNMYVIYECNQIVATASVIAETNTFAVINGVATHHAYRKRGYAKALIEQIINEYICVKGMGLILYYDNPNAQSIYKKKGFKDVNIWTSIDLYERYKKTMHLKTR